jgi:hypothetical protein
MLLYNAFVLSLFWIRGDRNIFLGGKRKRIDMSIGIAHAVCQMFM